MNFKIPAQKARFSLILMLILLVVAVVLFVVKVDPLWPAILLAIDVFLFLFGYILYDETTD